MKLDPISPVEFPGAAVLNNYVVCRVKTLYLIKMVALWKLNRKNNDFCISILSTRYFWLRSKSQKWDFELVSNELRSICFDRGGSLLACKNKILRAEKNETYEFNKINPDLASRVVLRVAIR